MIDFEEEQGCGGGGGVVAWVHRRKCGGGQGEEEGHVSEYGGYYGREEEEDFVLGLSGELRGESAEVGFDKSHPKGKEKEEQDGKWCERIEEHERGGEEEPKSNAEWNDERVGVCVFDVCVCTCPASLKLKLRRDLRLGLLMPAV